MKAKVKLRILKESRLLKIIITSFVIILFFCAIIIPSLLTMRPSWAAISFNRDALSGTREAFVEKVLLDDPNTFSPGLNVREAKNNESMIKATVNNKNSISYVSFGSIAQFDESGIASMNASYKNKPINYATLDGITPDKTNINSNAYPATRNFNVFLRVDKNSIESALLDSDWSHEVFINNKVSNLTKIDNNLKISYLFYSWIYESNEAAKILNKESEVPSKNMRYDFTNKKIKSYIDKIELDISKKIEIEVVGSSSVRKVLDLLSTDSNESFEYQAENNWGFFDVEFIKATNGSSDAFHSSIPGTHNPYIGLQSREPGEKELEDWGWNNNDKLSYVNFAIDALLVIYHSKEENKEENRYNIKLSKKDENGHNILYKLYSENNFINFNQIFENN